MRNRLSLVSETVLFYIYATYNKGVKNIYWVMWEVVVYHMYVQQTKQDKAFNTY